MCVGGGGGLCVNRQVHNYGYIIHMPYDMQSDMRSRHAMCKDRKITRHVITTKDILFVMKRGEGGGDHETCPTSLGYRGVLKGIYAEFQVIRGFSQKIPAGLLSYDQIHS